MNKIRLIVMALLCLWTVMAKADPTTYHICTAVTVATPSCAADFLSTYPGGTWTSSDNTVATVDASTGAVTTITAGAVTMTYNAATTCGNYSFNYSIVVDPVPSIGGNTPICVGSTITLTGVNGTPALPTAWTSDNTSVATIGGSTGVVSGISAGTANVTFVTTAGCSATAQVTVNPLSTPITGTLTVAAGGTQTLSNATPGGTWSISDASKATIGSSTGVVSGLSAGTATVTYTLATGCYVTAVVTVQCTAATISGGTTAFCANTSITLTASIAGGTWSSGNTSVATVDAASGVVTGIPSATTATVVITYTLGTDCSSYKTLTLNPAPGPITGDPRVCGNGTTTLSNATTGGTWSPTFGTPCTVGTSGVVTGTTVGYVYTATGAPALKTNTITYTLGGCSASVVVSVYPLPSIPAAITSTNVLCLSGTLAMKTTTEYPAGGYWSTSDPTIATVGSSSGVMSGVSLGTVNGAVQIIYAEQQTDLHCATSNGITVFDATISGSSSVCIGGTLSLTAPSTGGSWVSSNTAQGTVNSSGVVTGIATGTPNITYKDAHGGGCVNVMAVSVSSCGKMASTISANALAENAPAQQYSVMPNPSKGIISITQSSVNDESVSVRVINYSGTTVYRGSVSFTNGVGRLSIDNAVPGLYMVEVRDSKGNVTTFKQTIER